MPISKNRKKVKASKHTTDEQKIISQHLNGIRWIMDSGYSRDYAEILTLRAFPVTQTNIS